MKIYIAACFPQQSEVQEKALDLENIGHTVTSRWRFQKPIGVTGGEAEFADHFLQCAIVDLQDIDDADVLILLTGEVSRSGGKHVETGYAAAKGKRVMLVGPCENVFHWLFERHANWQQCLESLGKPQETVQNFLVAPYNRLGVQLGGCVEEDPEDLLPSEY
jgi:nucleoside 2-deoxyribosyltransferase